MASAPYPAVAERSRPDRLFLGPARAMADAQYPVEIIGGGSLGSVMADCVRRMGFRAIVIDFDTWEARNTCNSFAIPGQPKGDVRERVEQWRRGPAPCLLRILATDGIVSRSYAALGGMPGCPLAGMVDLRSGPNQVTIATLPRPGADSSIASPEIIRELMRYDAMESDIPDTACGDRGSMPLSLMAAAPAAWAIAALLRNYASLTPSRAWYGKLDLLLGNDGGFSTIRRPFQSRPRLDSFLEDQERAPLDRLELEPVGMPGYAPEHWGQPSGSAQDAAYRIAMTCPGARYGLRD